MESIKKRKHLKPTKGKVQIPKKSKGNEMFFCKKKRHFKECKGFKGWLNKKGTYGHFFSIEPLDNDCGNSWWFDTASPIHIITIPRLNESKICTAYGQALKVQAVGECKLLIKRNLISGSQLVLENNVSFYANKNNMLFYINDFCFGNADLIDGYWHINCIYESFNRSCKRTIYSINKIADTRADKTGHPKLSNLGTCVDCLKEKMTDSRSFNSRRSYCILELIHTYIYGPFPIETICGNKYFAAFIDDYSRFCHVYLMVEKSQVLDCFIKFKT
ncbi:hypothetical protein OSB04_007237 [Centaurea solstitialis]|uniref:Uncharacterized protein n=1 Tax=Centaurea solstitialis TaxID=347529 RepID=A0AA38U2R5_9ASTR|nr:hypothetical protein OSB04_007237 [Centaurea solstitialis]